MFKLKGEIVREMVAEVNPEVTRAQAAALGFQCSTGNWREPVADPDIDVVDTLTPLNWHCQKALAGLGALGDLTAHIVNMAH